MMEPLKAISCMMKVLTRYPLEGRKRERQGDGFREKFWYG